MDKNRIYYLDILRCIACIAIVMIHTSADYVMQYFGSFSFWMGNILDSISRFGVPVFVMISGSLMLDKKYNYSNKKLVKHVSKMIIFFIFWSVVYAIIYQIILPLRRNEQIDSLELLNSVVSGHYHLWFIYTITGLYLILPLLRLWIKDENKKYIDYFIILNIIFSFILPQIISVMNNYSDNFEHINVIIKSINTMIKSTNLKYFGGYITYFILGWYINNYEIKHKKMFYFMGGLGLIITIVATAVLTISKGEAIQMYGDLTINVFFYSIMIFIITKEFWANKNRLNKVVINISKNSFGIYAIHPLILWSIDKFLKAYNISMVVITIPVLFFGTVIISYICSFLISKVPILKNTV